MKKMVTFLMILVLLFISYEGLAWVVPVAQLTLCSFDSGAIYKGHAYLLIRNTSPETLSFCGYLIEPGDTISLGTWGDEHLDTDDGSKYGGLFINRECVSPTADEVAFLTTEITEDQFQLIEKSAPSESYYDEDGIDVFFHNCSTFAVKMWNLVAPTNIKVKETNIDIPQKLKENILLTEGGTLGHAKDKLPTNRQYDYHDIFYVTKDGALTPYLFYPTNSVPTEPYALFRCTEYSIGAWELSTGYNGTSTGSTAYITFI